MNYCPNCSQPIPEGSQHACIAVLKGAAPCGSCAILRVRVKELEEQIILKLDAQAQLDMKYDAEFARLRLDNARLQGIADRCGDVEGMAMVLEQEGEFMTTITNWETRKKWAAALSRYLKGG